MKYTILSGLVTVSAISLMSSPVFAQEAGDASARSGASDSEIIVTARRRDEAISKVPVAITAFSGETLASKQINSALELTKITPGLYFGATSALSQTIVTIRSFSRALSGPGAPGVISYFNDVPLNNFASNIPTYDISSLQVLKGPQGTLFGRNAIGGAILSYSKKPTHEFGGYAEGEYGSFNTMRLEGAVNVPIVKDKVSLRVAGQIRESDGFTKGYLFGPATQTYGPGANPPITTSPGIALNNAPIHLDKSSVKAVRASLLIEPVDGLSNVSVVDYTRFSGISATRLGTIINPSSLIARTPAVRNAIPLGAFTAGQLLNPVWNCGTGPNCDINLALAAARTNPRTQYMDVRPYSEVKSFGVTNTTVFDISDTIALKNIFGYRTMKLDAIVDVDGSGMNIVTSSSTRAQKQLTNELQLSGSVLDDRLSFVVGGFYYKTSPNGRGGDQTQYNYVLGGISAGLTTDYSVSKSKALYAQFDYDASALIEGLKFTAGYRETWDSQTGCAFAANYALTAQAGSNRVSPPSGVRPSYIPTEEECRTRSYTVDPNAVPNSTQADNLSAKFKKGTYTFAANWEVSDNILLYATARRGYRAGGFNTPLLGATARDAQSFDPEVLDDIELGAKGHFDIATRPVTFSLAAYRGKVKGAQTFISTSGVSPTVLRGVGIVLNKNDYTIKGVEGSLQIEAVEGLTLGGNFAYITAKPDSFSVPDSIRQLYAAANASALLETFAIYNQPKWQLNGNIEYVARDAMGGADFRMGADVHYQAKYAQGSIFVPSYTNVDARFGLVGLNDGRVDLTFWVKNLLDSTYYLSSALSSPAIGVTSFVPAAPRSIGATIRYRFGE